MRVALVLVVLLSAGEAWAETRFELAPGECGGDIVARVDEAPPGVDWALRDGDVVVRARSIDREPVTLVVLVEGHFLFMGNDTYENDPDSKYAGVHAKVADILQMPMGLPAGSLGAVVVYDSGGNVVRPLGPIDQMAGALGDQKDYAGKVTRDLVSGMSTALAVLRTAPTSRKVLMVISDGADTNVDTAKPALQRIRRQLDAEGIDIIPLLYSVGIGDELLAIRGLLPSAQPIQAFDDLVPSARRELDRIARGVVISFPADRLAWNDRDHDLELIGNGVVRAQGELVLVAAQPHGCFSMSSPRRGVAIALLVGGLAAAGFGLLVLWRRRRAATVISA